MPPANSEPPWPPGEIVAIFGNGIGPTTLAIPATILVGSLFRENIYSGIFCDWSALAGPIPLGQERNSEAIPITDFSMPLSQHDAATPPRPEPEAKSEGKPRGLLPDAVTEA
jgi:hypothetical protein